MYLSMSCIDALLCFLHTISHVCMYNSNYKQQIVYDIEMHADSVPLEATTCTHRDKFCLDVGAIVITGSARGKLVSALVAMVLPGSHRS